MPAIINYKICDQASACGGISVCPVAAFVYNEKLKRLEIDNDKCISCGACEKTCPIGAIGVAKTLEEYEELKKEIEEDPRRPEDLFVDRYGGDVVNDKVMVGFEDLNNVIAKQEEVLVELFNDDSIQCLIKSIPFKDILQNTGFFKYYRCNVGNNKLLDYNVKKLPSLLVCKNGKVVKVVEGYYEDNQKQALFNFINN